MTSIRDTVIFNRPQGIFNSTTVRKFKNNLSTGFNQNSINQENGFVNLGGILSGSSFGNSSSFRYDLQGLTGIKSTQQLNTDWSNYLNHVFFHSAQVKVNAGFQKIFDTFPFDGSKEETEIFFDKLTGYENYIFNLFPKSRNYLFFSGTNSGYENGKGTCVIAQDTMGSAYPTLSRQQDGSSVLNPGTNSMTFEFHLFVPPIPNHNSVILQKLSGTTGFSIVSVATNSVDSIPLMMIASSGSLFFSSSILFSPKGNFNHVAFVWDRTPGSNLICTFLNQELCGNTTGPELGNLQFNSAKLTIGSGSAVGNWSPTNTLSGALDELRVWHCVRNQEQREEFAKKNVYAQENLKLYYKFNEPSGSFTDIVIDSSGNSVHGTINSWASDVVGIREIGSASVGLPIPTSYEQDKINPILFSSYPDFSSLTGSLLSSAKIYDENNPNWIVRLVPNHLFQDGQQQDNTSDQEIIDGLNHTETSSGLRSEQMGQSQILLLLLYTWATYFDELKLFIDSFGNLNHLDYNSNDTISDEFLSFFANRFGITLPNLFGNSSIDQFVNGNKIQLDSFEDNSVSLQNIQNQIWRRILINIKDVLKNKGTIHGIKSLIRSIGIDPDNNFRIREFGGPTKRTMGSTTTSTREQKSAIVPMLNFVSGGLIKSPYLTFQRSQNEVGFPTTSSVSANDNLLTSGSWNIESWFQFQNPKQETQSLVRLETTSSFGQLLFGNLIAVSGSGLTWYTRPNAQGSSPVFSMSVNGFNPMDGNPWHFSVGRTRGDEFAQSNISSSYTLKVGKVSFGKISEEYSASVLFNDNTLAQNKNVWQNLNSTFNASGSCFLIGSGNYSYSPILTGLNDNTVAMDNKIRNSYFDGKIARVRFWSKTVKHKEWQEHLRNFKSTGADNSFENFNFNTNSSSSFNRLRVDLTMDQEISSSNSSGNFTIFDSSQNNFHFSGTLFPTSSQDIFSPTKFYYSFISSRFDEGISSEKVRVRSYQSFDNVLEDENHYAQLVPVYEIERSESPTDNTRFSIDFSIVDSLNEDIVSMFSSLEEIENIIGSPEQLFSQNYKDLPFLRDRIYFNRLNDKINLKGFFEFYKWFDDNIGNLLEKFLPRKTKYFGTNFVVESHLLERPKFQYEFADVYLGEDERQKETKSNITLQQFVGDINKF